MSTLAEKVAHAISDAIASDRLVLPTMPELALQVREVAENPDASIKQLASIIGSDAALTARIIKVANSVLYRGATKIQDLNMALARLGMTTSCTLATGLAMEQMFQATTDMVDRRLRQAWQASSEIAGMCTLMCKHYTRLRPDQAALAGLIHKIGVLPILSYAEDHPRLLKDSFTLDSIIKATHPTIGVKILTAWEFPKELQGIPAAHLDFSRKIPQADYADLVTVALLETQREQYGELDHKTVTAFARLGIDPTNSQNDQQDLHEAMTAAMGMLQ